MQPKVSIVCCTYDQAPFVEQTIRSLCLQVSPSFEVIVSDDASRDGTPEIITRIAQEYPGRLVPILGAVNLGIAGNLNRAIAACSGDLVAFCGGDDLFLPNKLAQQVAWLEHHPAAVLCAHDVEYFDAMTGVSRGRHSDFLTPGDSRGPRELLRRGNVFHALSVMVRRSALPTGGADTRIPISNDHKLWIDCLVGGGGYGYLPQVLAKYRFGGRVNVTVREPDRIWREGFQILGLVESEHPELTRDCQYGRARLFQLAALAHIKNNPTEARKDLFRALIHSALSPKLYFWLAVSFFPDALRKPFLDWRMQRPTSDRAC